MLERLFKLRQYNTSIRIEIIAGITIFYCGERSNHLF